MAIYAALGVAGSGFAFLLSVAFALAGLHASSTLYKVSLYRVLRSPISFFDTTPTGDALQM